MLKLLGTAVAAAALAFATNAAAAGSVDQFQVTSGSVTVIADPLGNQTNCREPSTYCWGIGGARLESLQSFNLTTTYDPTLPNRQWGYIRLDARNSGSGFDETFYVGFNVDGVDYKTYFTAPVDAPYFDVKVANIWAWQTPNSGLTRWIIGSDGPNGPIIDRIVLEAGFVPEPSTWAMMIVGFGLVGSTVRRRRAALA